MSNNTTNLTSFSDNSRILTFGAGATELLINLAAIPLAALNFVLIFRASVIHPNLKCILLYQSCFILIRGMCRFIGVIYVFLGIKSWRVIGCFYSMGIYCRNFVVHVLIIERIMATVMVQSYEQRRNWYFTVAWCPIVTLCGLYNTFAVDTVQREINLTTTTVQFLLGMAEFGIFNWLWRYNAKMYKKKFAMAHNHNLSERYQLSENIRIGKHLTPALLLHIFNIFTGGVSLYLNYFDVPGHNYFYTFMSLSNSFCGLLIEYTIIKCHPYLRRDFLHLVKRFFAFFGIRGSHVSSMSRDNLAAAAAPPINAAIGNIALRDILNGQNLITNENAEDHFQMLRRAWGNG